MVHTMDRELGHLSICAAGNVDDDGGDGSCIGDDEDDALEQHRWTGDADEQGWQGSLAVAGQHERAACLPNPISEEATFLFSLVPTELSLMIVPSACVMGERGQGGQGVLQQ